MNINIAIDPNGIASLILNRPHSHNAFDDTMIAELIAALNQIEKNPKAKILLIKSEGQSFSAGADLKWMKKMANATTAENLTDAKALAELMHVLYHFPKPTIALVQGPAYGGGIGLVACCHIVLASTNAVFCFSEVKLGLIPAVISPYVIKAIGVRQARVRFLMADTFDAAGAEKMGLCHEVVAPDLLEPRAQQIAKALLQNGPTALCEVNRFINQLSPLDIDLVALTAQKIAELRTSSEGKEGIAAFLEKRKPQWVPKSI